jgi:hypothetical protein
MGGFDHRSKNGTVPLPIVSKPVELMYTIEQWGGQVDNPRK